MATDKFTMHFPTPLIPSLAAFVGTPIFAMGTAVLTAFQEAAMPTCTFKGICTAALSQCGDGCTCTLILGPTLGVSTHFLFRETRAYVMDFPRSAAPPR